MDSSLITRRHWEETSRKNETIDDKLTMDAKRIPIEHVHDFFFLFEFTTLQREGTASSSLVTDFLEKMATTGASSGEEHVVTNVAWSIYASKYQFIYLPPGAYDTDSSGGVTYPIFTVQTASATGAFLHLVAKHPEVQRKPQEEGRSIVSLATVDWTLVIDPISRMWKLYIAKF